MVELKTNDKPDDNVKGSDVSPKLLLDALNRTNWNKTRVAYMLGISRPTLYKKIKEYNLINPAEE